MQNFRAKPGTKMAAAPEPSLEDHLWTIAVTRLLMPLDVAVQAPPNLAHAEFPRLLEAGIDDFGGVSPVTPDHVNPEAPWPERSLLARRGRRRAHAGAAPLHLPALPARRRALARQGRARRRAGRLRRRRAGARRGHLVRRHEPRAAARLAGRLPPAARGRGLVAVLARARPQRARSRPRRGRCRRPPERARPRGRAAQPGGRRAPRRALGRHRHLRRLPEHQLHQRLLLPLRVLRVLEGPAGRQPARAGLPARRRRGRAPLRRGVGSRRHGGLPAGRHPPRLHGHLVPRPRARHPGGAARPARARLLAARGVAGRGDRGLGAAGLPRAAARRRARQPAGHGARSSTTRCAASSAPTSCAPSSGSRSCARRTPSGCARRRRSCSGIEAPINQARHMLAIRDLQRETGGFTEFVPLPFVHEEAPIALKGLRATARRSARPSSCTRPRAWCSTRTCRTSRPPG